MTLTLAQIPGFVDVPESLLAAEQPAIGLTLQRSVGNAKFGMVRPEVFVGTYVHGDTVELPVSKVDGYIYERDELVYLWSYNWGGAGSQTTGSSKSGELVAQWYFGVFVHQDTGEVESWIKYRASESSKSLMTNDGLVTVFTIAIRRRTTLVLGAAPTFTDIADSEFNVDKAYTTGRLSALVHNSKFAAVNSEAIYMGEYVHGDVIATPVSPVDGYAYSYAETKFIWSWRWTCQPDKFVDPLLIPVLFFLVGLNQLDNFTGSIDSTGHVSLTVDHYDDGVTSTHDGRISVVALCQRTMPAVAVSSGANFVDVDESLLDSGNALRDDVLKAMNWNAKCASMRPEFFIAEYAHGATVPLPTSPIDGYVYTRGELQYTWELRTTLPRAASENIRIEGFGSNVDENGLVSINITRCLTGGAAKKTNEGKLLVVTWAMRGHVHDNTEGVPIVQATPATEGTELVNGSFDRWTTPNQNAADDWTIRDVAGTVSASKRDDGTSDLKQRLTCNAGSGNFLGLRSSKLAVTEKALRYFGFEVTSDVATTAGLTCRILFFNRDRLNSCLIDILPNIPFTGALQHFDMWLEVPTRSDTTVVTSRGTKTIVGTLDFVPAFCYLQLMVFEPNVNVNADFNNAQWTVQANPAAGQVANKGPAALAYFPAIALSFTDTTCDVDLNFDLKRVDGSITVPTNKHTEHITGLTAGTQYALELYYDEVQKIFAAMVTGHGSNGWCYLPSELTRDLAVAWADLTHLPLSDAPIYFTTNAAAGPPSGGGGGGDGGCHRSDVWARTRERGNQRLEDVREGEHLWDVVDGKDCWRRVVVNELKPHEHWCHVDFSNGVTDLPCTLGHPFETVDGSVVHAEELSITTAIPDEHGYTTPRRIEMRKYLARIARIRLEAPYTFMVSMDGSHWVKSHNNRAEGTV